VNSDAVAYAVLYWAMGEDSQDGQGGDQGGDGDNGDGDNGDG